MASLSSAICSRAVATIAALLWIGLARAARAR